MTYQATLACRRCGREYSVLSFAEAFTWWFCHRTQSWPMGRPCLTFNTWKRGIP